MNNPTNKASLQLMPDGVFLVTLANGQHVKGRFSMYALDRFCNSKEIKSYFLLFQKITIGMTIGEYAELVLIAIQDYYREDVTQCLWTKVKVMDEIFEGFGGFASNDLLALFKHAIGRLNEIVDEDDVAPVKKKEVRKKSR